jgi:DNA primase
VECFFDSDSAGQKAALRFLPMALKAGLEVRFLTAAGAGKLDPDLLFLEKGIAAYEELRAGAQRAMAFACRAILPQPAAASAEHKARAAQMLYELIAAAESAVARSEFLQESASHLRLPLAAIEKDFQAFLTRGAHQAAARANANPEPAPPAVHQVANPNTPEQHLLMLCLHFEAVGKAMALSRELPHEWIDGGHVAGRLLNRFLGEFEHNAWPGRDHLDPLLESAEERALVATLLFETPIIEDPVKVAQEGIRQLRTRALEPRLRQIELALANAGADSDSDPISLLKERVELQRQLRQPLVLSAVV